LSKPCCKINFQTGVLNLFKDVAQIIKKQRIRGPPTMQLVQCEDCCCTCTQQKQKQLLMTQPALQSKRGLSLFIARKHRSVALTFMSRGPFKRLSTVLAHWVMQYYGTSRFDLRGDSSALGFN